MAQTPEIRMVKYYRSLKRDREYQHFMRKGWYAKPHMQVAMRFKVPIKHVKAVLEAHRGVEL